jgi:hypothetical protein
MCLPCASMLRINPQGALSSLSAIKRLHDMSVYAADHYIHLVHVRSDACRKSATSLQSAHVILLHFCIQVKLVLEA